MIELEKIEKIYNAGKATETHALKDINLRIEEGDMVAITGPSGSGKSTLLHIIAGIDSPSSGEYRFCGKLVSDMAFKPLIDFINDQLSMEMIVYDEEAKTMGGNTYIQNIETVNGSASQQNSGVINTYNTTNDTSSMLELIDKLLASLPEIQGVDAEEIENVKDDLEMVQEQLKTDNPKKNRIGKALVGIKKFAGDFSMKLAVTLAAGAVTGADWGMLLQQLENFIR